MAVPRGGYGGELNARQRKNVYMHSTIFSGEGPTEKSVYTPSTQHELLSSISPNLRKHNQTKPDIDLPRPADLAATQHAGHGVVMPSDIAHHQPFSVEGGGKHPRETGKEAMVGTGGVHGDAIKVVQAQGKDGRIPKEFWATSVQLQWHDPRNEISRTRDGRSDLSSCQDMKLQELSSEVFGKERNVTASTTTQRQELLAETAHALQNDSALDRNVDRMDPRTSASARFHNNLRHSGKNAHAVATTSGAQEALPPPREDEDPANRGRRRQEKNFSDLFDVRMADRQKIGERKEMVESQTCSFLDTRTEISVRNKGKWRPGDATHPSERLEAERRSELFDHVPPEKPDVGTPVRTVHNHERCFWETKDSMHTGCEIARRRRTHDHHVPTGEVNGSAFDRKHVDLASDQVRNGMGAESAAFVPRTDADNDTYRARQRAAGGYVPSNVSAKETKLASLQSSIFA